MIGYLLLFLWQKEGKKVSIVETFLAAPSSKRNKKASVSAIRMLAPKKNP
jgi:hypothetical protein